MKRQLVYSAGPGGGLDVTELERVLADLKHLDAPPGGAFSTPVVTIAPLGARSTIGTIKKLAVESWR